MRACDADNSSLSKELLDSILVLLRGKSTYPSWSDFWNHLSYAWAATGGRVNFDLHAHSGGEPIDYERGAGQTEGAGTIEAPFAGDHGWFWRNRDSTPITMTIQVRGEYSDIVETY